MKNIKNKILEKSKKLFNLKGVANVSIREISREVGISHSNLMYHFKDKNDLLNSLHQQILESALQLNKKIVLEKNVLKSLFVSTVEGFNVIYDFRFFMIDFNLIVRENKELHTRIKEIEKLRFKMYDERITLLVKQGVMRKEDFEGEYDGFITQIRVFSDYWVSSYRVYEKDSKLNIKKYVKLFLLLFYPYLTVKGKGIFNELLLEFEL